MMKFANAAAYFFIASGFILAVISVAGIWGLFHEDVIWKSFQSIGLIAIGCIVFLIVESISSGKTGKSVTKEDAAPLIESLSTFGLIHKVSATTIIVSITICVFLGLLSIWDLMQGDVLYKSLSSIVTIGFFSLLTLGVCAKREGEIRALKVTDVPAQTTV